MLFRKNQLETLQDERIHGRDRVYKGLVKNDPIEPGVPWNSSSACINDLAIQVSSAKLMEQLFDIRKRGESIRLACTGCFRHGFDQSKDARTANLIGHVLKENEILIIHVDDRIKGRAAIETGQVFVFGVN